MSVLRPRLRDGDRPANKLAEALARYEARLIRRTLKRHHGHVGRSAEALGLDRRALERKMARYALRAEAAAARTEADIPGPRLAEA